MATYIAKQTQKLLGVEYIAGQPVDTSGLDQGQIARLLRHEIIDLAQGTDFSQGIDGGTPSSTFT